MAETFTLNSSWLASGSYDAETKTLTLTTQTGNEYTLEGVPEETVQQFKEASSPGSFFSRHLKGRF